MSTTEPFAHGTSPIHAIDPRMRLLGAVVLTIPAALCQRMETAFVALGMGLLLAALARLHPIRLTKRLLAVNLFTIFLWPFLPFTTPGVPIFTVMGIAASAEGLHLALLITLKTNAIVLSLTSLMGTISVRDLGPAMQSLHIPDKLCHMLVFTHRYAVLIRQELALMLRAARARGFHPSTNLHTYRSYAWLAGMLLVRSWDRAERVDQAMRCRGFSGRFHTLTHFQTGTADRVFFLFALVAAALLTGMEILRNVQ